MKKFIITIGSNNSSVAENLLKNFDLEKENSHTYSFEYDNDDEDEVEAADEFEEEIGTLLAQNKIEFQITREFVD